jgi:hypothetical protein
MLRENKVKDRHIHHPHSHLEFMKSDVAVIINFIVYFQKIFSKQLYFLHFRNWYLLNNRHF